MSNRNFGIFLIFTLSMSALIPLVYAQDNDVGTAPPKVVSFLRDVVSINMSAYSLSATKPAVAYWDDLGGLPETSGKVTLRGPYGILEATYSLVGDNLRWLHLYTVQGEPQFKQKMPTDLKEQASDFLDRYRAFLNDDSVIAMQKILDSADLTKSTTVKSDNLRFNLDLRPAGAHLSWSAIFNDAVYPGLGFGFDKEGVFNRFGDDRAIYKVGGTDINVTRQDAVDMALKRADNYSYTYENQTIKDFDFAMDRISAELLTMGRENPLLLYPYWTVDLYLKEDQPGFINSIEVRLWADTGHIIDIKPMGYGGDADPTVTQTPTTEPSAFPSSAGPHDFLSGFVIAGLIAGVIAAGGTYLIVKRKKRFIAKHASTN